MGELKCYHCQLPYDINWPGELIIQDSLWLKISPIGHEGGILCPNCIVKALIKKTGRTAVIAIVMEEGQVYKSSDLDILTLAITEKGR